MFDFINFFKSAVVSGPAQGVITPRPHHYGGRKTLYTIHKNIGKGRVYRNKGVQEAARRLSRMTKLKEAV